MTSAERLSDEIVAYLAKWAPGDARGDLAREVQERRKLDKVNEAGSTLVDAILDAHDTMGGRHDPHAPMHLAPGHTIGSATDAMRRCVPTAYVAACRAAREVQASRRMAKVNEADAALAGWAMRPGGWSQDTIHRTESLVQACRDARAALEPEAITTPHGTLVVALNKLRDAAIDMQAPVEAAEAVGALIDERIRAALKGRAP
jgi:hypothetical protein